MNSSYIGVFSKDQDFKNLVIEKGKYIGVKRNKQNFLIEDILIVDDEQHQPQGDEYKFYQIEDDIEAVMVQIVKNKNFQNGKSLGIMNLKFSQRNMDVIDFKIMEINKMSLDNEKFNGESKFLDFVQYQKNGNGEIFYIQFKFNDSECIGEQEEFVEVKKHQNQIIYSSSSQIDNKIIEDQRSTSSSSETQKSTKVNQKDKKEIKMLSNNNLEQNNALELEEYKKLAQNDYEQYTQGFQSMYKVKKDLDLLRNLMPNQRNMKGDNIEHLQEGIENMRQEYFEIEKINNQQMENFELFQEKISYLNDINERIQQEIITQRTSGLQIDFKQLKEIQKEYQEFIRKEVADLKNKLKKNKLEAHKLQKSEVLQKFLLNLDEINRLNQFYVKQQEIMNQEKEQKSILDGKTNEREQQNIIYNQNEKLIEFYEEELKKMKDEQQQMEQQQEEIKNQKQKILNSNISQNEEKLTIQARKEKDRKEQELFELDKKFTQFRQDSDNMYEEQLKQQQETLAQLCDVAQNFHFILLLDNSSSMKDQWSNLLKIVNIFVQQRSAKGDDRISIIKFDDKAKIEIENEPVRQMEEVKIEFQGGGTNFLKAFTCLESCLNMTSSGYRPLIIFLTDGISTNEQAYIQKLNDIKKVFQTTFFIGIGFGPDIAQGSDGWNKLLKISEILNQSKKEEIMILGQKMHAVNSAQNEKALKQIFDKLGDFSVNQTDAVKKQIEVTREAQFRDIEQRRKQMELEESLIKAQLQSFNRLNEDNQVMYKQSVDRQIQEFNKIIEELDKFIEQIKEKSIQKQKQITETIEQNESLKLNLEEGKKDLKKDWEKFKQTQNENQLIIQSYRQQQEKYIETWGFVSQAQYNKWQNEIDQGNKIKDFLFTITKNITQMNKLINRVESEFKNIFSDFQKLEKGKTDNKIIQAYAFRDVSQILGSDKPLGEYDSKLIIEKLFNYLYHNQDPKYDEFHEILQNYLLNIQIDQLMTLEKDDNFEDKLDQILEDCFEQAPLSDDIQEIKQINEQIQEKKEEIKDLKKENKQKMPKEVKDEIKQIEKDIKELQKELSQVKKPILKQMKQIALHFHQFLNSIFQRQTIKSVNILIQQMGPVHQRILKISNQNQMLSLTSQ